MNEDFVLEPAAFLDLWQDKYFLGQEFLTWLWIESEINGNLLNIKPIDTQALAREAFPQAVELWFENRLTLESGMGGDKNSVTCQTPGTQWAEAHAALRQGKKITKGQIKVLSEEKEWSFGLSADNLTPQGLKFPKTFASSEEEEDTEIGRFMERIVLFNELTAILESLYKEFLELRLSTNWKFETLPRLSKWIADQEV